jgi:hypothetical protein
MENQPHDSMASSTKLLLTCNATCTWYWLYFYFFVEQWWNCNIIKSTMTNLYCKIIDYFVPHFSQSVWAKVDVCGGSK